ncbi:uncharacterized protein LOC112539958 [Tetranychus urticae]|uniref:uncharacterized protein LOC112539958 n=1 Tax=Tetranychus urticae TaxID=32264 RepID=UPI000D65EDF5|nr:uncharacterized protein LOC112539958 [Tetranychus urticae]
MDSEGKTTITTILGKKTTLQHNDFKNILEIITKHGEANESNSNNIADILQDPRFLNVTTQMINDQNWISELNPDNVRVLTSFNKMSKLMVTTNTVPISEPSQMNTSSFGNNKMRKSITQFMTMDETEPKTWFKIEPVITCFTIIVKIKEIKNKRGLTSAAQIQTEIEKLLIENDNPQIKVRKVIPSYECCKIKCETANHRKNLLELIKKERPTWQCETQLIRPPQIKLIGVKYFNPEKNLEQQFIRYLEKKNQWPLDKENNKIIAYNQTNQAHDLIIQILPSIRERIEKNKGWVNVGHGDVRAIDYFNIKLCRKCANFGHAIRDCKNMTRCGYCTKRHNETCRNQQNSNEWVCPNCRRKGHNAFQVICPVFIERLKVEIEKINFPYESIMH